jgi:hypothetical protein
MRLNFIGAPLAAGLQAVAEVPSQQRSAARQRYIGRWQLFDSSVVEANFSIHLALAQGEGEGGVRKHRVKYVPRHWRHGMDKDTPFADAAAKGIETVCKLGKARLVS